MARLPVATYRIQFNARFTLRQATELVPYLADLGVSDLYASPLLAARAGSLHGYDVVDPSRLNPEIGSEEDLAALSAVLQARDMGLLLDIVPNHMCVSDPGNRWWADVLENGPSSPFAGFFDIDWLPPKGELAQKVLLPFLGDQYGSVLESGSIRIGFRGGAFVAEVYDNALPVGPRTWPLILRPVLDGLRNALPEGDETLTELESILTALSHLPAREETSPDRVRERMREKEVIKRRLQALHERSPELREALEARLLKLNGRAGEPDSFDELESLLGEQGYRLCFWQVAADEINYRRFFDVNELGAIRVEDPEVFKATHALILDLVRRGVVNGLRIDHVDGLYDPLGYLRMLHQAAAELGTDPYLLVEKILSEEERLPPDWPVRGTTGYDFLNDVNGFFVDLRSAEAFREGYARLRGSRSEVADLLATCKKLIMNVAMASELYVLACRLDEISERHRSSRDFTRESLRFALREVVARFPVYRTYLRPEGGDLDLADRRHVDEAVLEAVRRNPATSPSLFEFIRRIWIREAPEPWNGALEEERRRFVLRLQQFTGPVMAKGLEDTLFYRHFPLLSLAEVGADPSAFGLPIEEFHQRNRRRAEEWPLTLLATSTHDTKRGEDARARLNALSEIPGPWFEAVDRWRALNRGKRSVSGRTSLPEPNEEYLFYQTLLAAWPLDPGPPAYPRGFPERIESGMLKALREAKVHTSWIHPNVPYEESIRRFLRAALTDRAFLADFASFAAPVIRAGVLNSISQLFLKLCAPGVPDVYQGSEGWDFSLVDPDNRRPLDPDASRARLASLLEEGRRAPEGLAARLLAAPADGRVKMHVLRTVLRFRAARPALFAGGGYEPVPVPGGRVFAFRRAAEGRSVLVVAGRRFLRSRPDPEDAREALTLPEGVPLRDALSGRLLRPVREGEAWTIPIPEVFAELPAALLHPEP